MIQLTVVRERQMKTQRLMDALHQGVDAPTQVRIGPPDRHAPFMTWGHLFHSAKAISQGVADRTPFWFIDNGYWKPARGGPNGYYSITYRDIGPKFLRSVEDSRIPAPVEPWREKPGGYVLLALPGMNYGAMLGFDMVKWARTIKSRIQRHTRRNVVVRRKGSRTPLQDDLAGAWCCVTHSSKVAVDAALAGVPVVVEPTNPAAPVGRTDLSQIEDPIYPDRRKWWASLMAQQFTIPEMKTGLAWRILKRNAEEIDGKPIEETLQCQKSRSR